MAMEPPDFERRFGGTRRLYGATADGIFALHVCLVGIGGVGSWVAEALARLGVGRLTLIDMDHVSESNINRQIHATDVSLGQSKVQAMRERISSFHPQCVVDTIDDFVTADNWPALALQLQAHGVQVLVDACDQWRAKVAMAAWAMRERYPLICVGAAGGKRKPQALELDDLSAVTHDPLLAKMRYELRKHHGRARTGRMGLQCVFSREAVLPAQDACEVGAVASDGSLNCHGYGSAATVTATFAMVAAAAAVEAGCRVR
jgi:tRNA threonylcarbamoyladenosine dehydratase